MKRLGRKDEAARNAGLLGVRPPVGAPSRHGFGMAFRGGCQFRTRPTDPWLLSPLSETVMRAFPPPCRSPVRQRRGPDAPELRICVDEFAEGDRIAGNLTGPWRPDTPRWVTTSTRASVRAREKSGAVRRKRPHRRGRVGQRGRERSRSLLAKDGEAMGRPSPSRSEASDPRIRPAGASGTSPWRVADGWDRFVTSSESGEKLAQRMTAFQSGCPTPLAAVRTVSSSRGRIARDRPESCRQGGRIWRASVPSGGSPKRKGKRPKCACFPAATTSSSLERSAERR